MAVPGKTGSQYKDSEQVILSDSRDDKYGVLATEMVAENAAGTALLRPTAVPSTATAGVTGIAVVNPDGSNVNGGAGGGGGTEYTEDAVAAANPVGTAVNLVRQDTPAALTTTDGDNVAQRGTNYGAAYTQIVSSTGSFIDTFGGGTQYSDGDANADPTGTVAMGTDGSNVFALHTDTAGDLQVDVLSSALPTGAATAANQQTDALTDTQLRATPVPVSATDLDIRNLTNTDVVTAELSAVDNAVLDTIAAKDFATQTTLSALNAKFVTGTDIGDVTINNASGASAVNIQDGGNSITVDGAVTVSGTATVSATDLDIRNLAPATDTVAIGDGTSTATVRNLAANDALNVSIVDASGDQITSFGAADGATETTLLSVKTAVETLDNAISGSEMQVDVVAALPAGTNAIGKLAANSGVDIGDVTLNNTLGAGTSDASTVRTTVSTGATSTLANVSGSASSVTLVASNTDRRKVVMYNDSTADCYVKYGSTASATSFTWLMAAGSHIEEDCYNGIITGIWGSASGSMRVTEVS